MMKYIQLIITCIFSVIFLPHSVAFAQIPVNSPPITGTFLMLDTFNASEAFFDHFMADLKELGADTLIYTAVGRIVENPCDPYQKGPYSEESFLNVPTRGQYALSNFLKSAKKNHMKVFLSAIDANLQCITYWDGQLYNENTDKGKYIEANIRIINGVKDYVTSQGWDWNDPNFIQGFFIGHEVGITQFLNDAPIMGFFTDLSRRLKEVYPNKLISTSPWMWEQDDYQTSYQAFVKLFSDTSIDILLPQDSMGSGKVTSYARSSDHFRALRDAANRVNGKQAWANIETFQKNPNWQGAGSEADQFMPSTIEKVSAQIEAARPYVKKNG